MKQITEVQRYQIESFLKAGKSKEYIAQELNVVAIMQRRPKNYVMKKRKGLPVKGASPS